MLVVAVCLGHAQLHPWQQHPSDSRTQSFLLCLCRSQLSSEVMPRGTSVGGINSLVACCSEHLMPVLYFMLTNSVLALPGA